MPPFLWQTLAMPVPQRTMVIGGNGAIAVALRRSHLPGATYVVRSGAGPSDRLVDNYRNLAATDFAGYDAIINCAGAVSGGPGELEHANVDLPVTLARAARAAGATVFVHVSSFSVYGRAESIGTATPARPLTPYGRSKLAGDEALLSLADERFRPVVVRFPAIIDPERAKGKVARLISAWLRLGFIPTPSRAVRRSMISTSLAARVIAEVANAPTAAVILAADARPFTYEGVVQAIDDRLGRQLGVMPLPSAILAPLRLLLPRGAYQSMFGDSMLERDSNFAAAMPSDLHATIAKLAAAIAPK